MYNKSTKESGADMHGCFSRFETAEAFSMFMLIALIIILALYTIPVLVRLVSLENGAYGRARSRQQSERFLSSAVM